NASQFRGNCRMLDLQGFLKEHHQAHIQVRKPVPLDTVGALVAQAADTIVFHNLQGFPDYRLVENLFLHRGAMDRVLSCEPCQVVPHLAKVLRHGPRPLQVVDQAPCEEHVLTGDDLDLATLPVVRHTDLDPYPYTTSFAIHRDPETGQYNSMFPRCGVLGRSEMVASFVTPTANPILPQPPPP